MFSRWALKKVCKFVLKKKLGHLILGDIDVEQLDVQLTEGTIQLNDLALNVDYLNEKVRFLILSFEFSILISLIMKYKTSIFVLVNEKSENCAG